MSVGKNTTSNTELEVVGNADPNSLHAVTVQYPYPDATTYANVYDVLDVIADSRNVPPVVTAVATVYNR